MGTVQGIAQGITKTETETWHEMKKRHKAEERVLVRDVLVENDWNVSHAAKDIGIGLSSMQRAVKRHEGLDDERLANTSWGTSDRAAKRRSNLEKKKQWESEMRAQIEKETREKMRAKMRIEIEREMRAEQGNGETKKQAM